MVMRRFKFLLTVCFLGLVLSGIWRVLPLPVASGQGGALTAPTNLVASDGDYNNKIGLTWDTMRGATRYQVFRHTVNDTAAAVGLGTTVEAAFFDKTAVAGQTYFYWVRAENATAASSLSAADTGVR